MGVGLENVWMCCLEVMCWMVLMCIMCIMCHHVLNMPERGNPDRGTDQRQEACQRTVALTRCPVNSSFLPARWTIGQRRRSDLPHTHQA